MATTAKINIKNIDYFKFKKIVIDGNRDDYAVCSKEVKALCDSVQTLFCRDEEFDMQSDRARFDEICTHYGQILQSKRIDPLDMRIKSGWWGDQKGGYSAGKIKPAALMEVLVAKTRDWAARHGGIPTNVLDKIDEKVEGPGLYVFKHKEHQCFQYIGRAENVFARCAETLKGAFEGAVKEPLAALLVISMSTDWDFYFIPVSASDGSRILRILENDLILKHDCIWPHGLNFSLHIDSLLEVSEFRKSCLRHHWPPETDSIEEKEIDLGRLRKQVAACASCSPDKASTVSPDQNHHRSDVTGSQDDVDAEKPGPKKQTRPPTASKVRPASAAPTYQKTTPSPTKPSTEKITTASSKTLPKSPNKQTTTTTATTTTTTTKPAHHNADNKDAEHAIETSGPSEADSNSTQGEPEHPTLQRSNTFTYSDSESSESSDPTKDKGSSSSSGKAPKTPTKQSTSAAKQASRLPTTTSSQRA